LLRTPITSIRITTATERVHIKMVTGAEIAPTIAARCMLFSLAFFHP
jgi:hypothetical protein